MYEYSTINKTAEAAGPLADLEAVERVRDGIVKAATQHWHCHIMERSNLDQALRYAELNDQLRNMSAYVVACPVCGRPVRYDHLAQDAYGDDMCPDCLMAAGYVKCDHCGEWIDEAARDYRGNGRAGPNRRRLSYRRRGAGVLELARPCKADGKGARPLQAA